MERWIRFPLGAAPPLVHGRVGVGGGGGKGEEWGVQLHPI